MRVGEGVVLPEGVRVRLPLGVRVGEGVVLPEGVRVRLPLGVRVEEEIVSLRMQLLL
jgi:hypothetical protein